MRRALSLYEPFKTEKWFNPIKFAYDERSPSIDYVIGSAFSDKAAKPQLACMGINTINNINTGS